MAAPTTRPSPFKKLKVVHACSVGRTSTLMLCLRMKDIILVENAGVNGLSPIPMTSTSIFGSKTQNKLRDFSSMCSWLWMFQARTVLKRNEEIYCEIAISTFVINVLWENRHRTNHEDSIIESESSLAEGIDHQTVLDFLVHNWDCGFAVTLIRAGASLQTVSGDT